MARTLFRRWTIPAWVALLVIAVENVRRVFGWWNELDFFWDRLKHRNEVLDAIISPVEGKGFVERDLKLLENLRDAIVQNAAKRGRPRPTASHPQDHQPEAPET